MHREPPPALRRDHATSVPRLALRAADAARALAISEPTLRNLSDLPRVRLGTAVLYRTATLDQWLASRERAPGDEQADTNHSPSTD